MQRWICMTCGTQFEPRQSPPEGCPICLDERQYVRPDGQAWTTLQEMRNGNWRNDLTDLEPGLTGIRTNPEFAIGQRALLVQTSAGNVLWDCISFVDEETVAAVKRLGGIQAIAVSHPHYYSTIGEWAEAFDAPIYLHAADREWAMAPSTRIHFWNGDELGLFPGVTLLRLGGHFPGSTVMHWAGGASGWGALLTGDTIQVVADRNWVTFMYSYPNEIPLPAQEVKRLVDRLGDYRFERLYGFKPDRIIESDARSAVLRSRDRYISALQGAYHG